MQPYTHFNPNHVTTYTAERSTIRAIMCLSATFNLKIEQFDISSAFLHEQYNHTTPVFIQQLPRFDGTYKHPCRAGKLIGNLYGTPPASYIYFEALTKFLKTSGYKQANSDPCLFFNNTRKGNIFVTVTIDDFFVAASTTALIDKFYSTLKSRYTIRRLGEPKLFLNWRIERFLNGSIHISQPHTIRAILAKHKLQDCNPKPTPYADVNSSATKTSAPLTHEKTLTFRQTVGELRYLADSTRPDIAHAVSRLATVMHTPCEINWGQLRYLLKYLRGTVNHGILYNAPFAPLQTYSDAGFANFTDRKSYTGIVHILSRSPIMWQSTKQKTVAMSTCEAEYLSASSAAQQSMWLQRLLSDIGHTPKPPASLLIDNYSAIQVARNTSPTKHRKYIDLRHHFIQDLIQTERLRVEHTPSLTMLADILTKPMKPQRFHSLRSSLNVVPPPPRTAISVQGTDRAHISHADSNP